MDETDQQLIESYFDGDEAALAVLVNRYLKPVYNFAFRLTGNQADAEDVSQETFLKAWKNIKKFRADENFKAWILKIARNTAYDL